MKVHRALTAIALVALTGCTSVGDLYDRWFGSVPGPKPAPLVTFQATAQPRIAWQANVGPAERNMFFPVVTGNVVYAAGAAGQIAGFDVTKGAPVSRFNAGQRLSGGVGASGTLILVGTSRG